MEKEVEEELKSRLKDEFSNYTEIAGGKNYRYRHLKTVLEIVHKLKQNVETSEEIDENVLEIAALYHDIGRKEDIEDGEMDPFEGHEGHDERGAKIIEEYVSDFVTEDQLKKIQRIIRNHHSEPQTVEGKIVQDADKVSNFGVNNLWRQIHYAAEHERTFDDSLEYFWDSAVDRYRGQMKKLNFDYTKKVAEKRLERHKQAIERIEMEMDGEDF
ncbi:MAG: HD domain-containing protein [Nanohaloarchaea archaeon]|nr:HD domain-containing protein [Candidatus Nanohaloarchaea archaeon]